MASKPPYFPFYVKDFAADDVVEAMSTTGVGAYILLLCKAWQQDPPASLPTDDRKLARWARLTSDEWAEVKPEVVAAFRLGKDDRLHQSRMRREFEKFRDKSQKASESANRRWHPDKTTNQPPHSERIANAMQRAYGSGCGSGSSSEGGCGGNRNTHNLLERIGGAKKHVPAIGAFVRSSSEAVALWWDVAKTGKAVSVLAVMASRAANQTTPPPITIEAVYEACAQGVVRSVDGHEVAGASHIGKNANGLYFDQKLILPYARLAEDVYA